MSVLDSLPARILLRNGALLIIPPMLITFGLWGALPAAYGSGIFWREMPEWLGLFENIFRLVVFSLPGILFFGKKEKGHPLGWYLYIGGLVVYLASYLAQIVYPESVWSQSMIGFMPLPGQLHSGWQALVWYVCRVGS